MSDAAAMKCGGCSTVPAHGANAFSKCGRCEMMHYCSRTCQRSHWPTHKADCFSRYERKAQRGLYTRSLFPQQRNPPSPLSLVPTFKTPDPPLTLNPLKGTLVGKKQARLGSQNEVNLDTHFSWVPLLRSDFLLHEC